MSANLVRKRRYGSLALGAETLDVSERTIRRMIANGLIKGFKVGPRLVRVDLNEIEALPVLIPSGGRNG
jgi:excisionase family DNA binding protein